MKTLSAELAAVCYGGNVQAVADLFTITLADATVLRWTPFDVSLSYGGNTWTNPGIYLDTPVARDALGLEVATTRISLASATVTIGGVSVQQAAVQGAFRGARVDIYRTYMTTPGTVPGIVQRFSGKVSDVEPGSLRVGLTIRSFMAELDGMLPKRTTSALCPYAVYSPECGALYVQDVRTVAAGSTRKVINFSASTTKASIDGWITFLSGALEGQRHTIAEVYGSPATSAELYLNLPATPAVGDSIQIVRGCDKGRATCDAVFDRLVAFGGMPEMPAEESV